MKPIIYLMGLIGWIHHNNPKDEVQRAADIVKSTMDDLIKFFPRETGAGWNIPKVKGAMLMRVYMMYYGNAINFYGGFGERAHVDFVKTNAPCTQRRATSFCSQLKDRVTEQVILDKSSETILQQYKDEIEEMPLNSSMRRKQIDQLHIGTNEGVDKPTPTSVNNPVGRYEVTVTNTPTQVETNSSRISTDAPEPASKIHIKWHNRHKEKKKKGRDISAEMKMFLMRQLHESEEYDNLFAVGYQTAYVQFPDIEGHTIIKCTDKYNDDEWYDFVSFREGDSIVAGKVVGILNCNGTLSFVIHAQDRPTQRTFNFSNTLLKDFVTPFRLGGTERIIAVKIEDLVAPLIVFPNYGKNTKRDFMALLPKRKWHKFYSNLIGVTHQNYVNI